MGAWVVQGPNLVKKYFRDHRTSNAPRNPKLPYSLDILQRLFFFPQNMFQGSDMSGLQLGKLWST